MDTTKTWQSYVAWLETHVPLAYANLAPPATEQAIAALEAQLGTTLPVAVKDVWRCNDGQRVTMIATNMNAAVPCIPTLSFLSTAAVGAIWQEWHELRQQPAAQLADLQAVGSSLMPERVKPLYTSPGWIPLWADPTRADYIGVDLDPAAQGVRGQVINFGRDEDRHVVFYDDVGALVKDLLAEVQGGGWQATRMPYGKAAEIDWFGDPNGHFFNALHARRPKTPIEIARELVGQGRKLRNGKRAAEALPLVEQARAACPTLGTALIQLEADVYEDLGRWVEAERALTTLIETFPKQRAYVVRRATMLIDHLARPAEARAVLDAGLARFPGDSQLEQLRKRTDG